MIILAVDYGYERTGLAVCDKTETLASPIGTIKESYMPKVARRGTKGRTCRYRPS